MKTFKQILLLVLITFTGTSYAQNSENLFEEFLFGGIDDANILLEKYMAPGIKSLSYGVNSGWYNTAKPHETLGFDITISYVNAQVVDADLSFEFLNSDYAVTTLLSGPSTLPTIMGVAPSDPANNTAISVLEASVSGLPPVPYNAPDGVQGDLASYTLSGVAVPVPLIQAGIGLVKGTEIKVRWLPNIDQDGFSFKYFGLGAMHSISQWIPVFKNIPVDISAFIGWNTISAEYIIPFNAAMPGSNQKATTDINTFTYQLIASAHLSIVTVYVSAGADNFKTNFKMLGTYEISPGVELPPNPIDITVEGAGGFRSSYGVRLKLAIVTLSADYTLREYNTLTLSLGFSVR